MTWPFDPLQPFSAQVIVADPPWNFKLYSAKGETKSAQAHYRTMDIEAIKALPVGQLARGDCWLFLWATAPMLPDALDVMRAWGFRYVSRAAWRKTTASGKLRLGTGYVVRSLHEDVLIGALGAPSRAKPMRSLFDGVAREHSRKPDEFFDLVEAFAPLSFRVELFSRQSRLGWATWGDQSGLFDQGERN